MSVYKNSSEKLKSKKCNTNLSLNKLNQDNEQIIKFESIIKMWGYS